MSDPARPANLNRRELLQFAGCAAAAAVLPACGAEEMTPAVTCMGTPTAQALTVTQAMADALQVNKVLEVKWNDTPLFLTRDSKGLMILHPRCPHAGVFVQYKANEGTFVCPHQGSTFAIDGSLKKGPATKGLDHLSVCRSTDSSLRIEPNMMVDANTRLT